MQLIEYQHTIIMHPPLRLHSTPHTKQPHFFVVSSFGTLPVMISPKNPVDEGAFFVVDDAPYPPLLRGRSSFVRFEPPLLLPEPSVLLALDGLVGILRPSVAILLRLL